MRYVLVLVAFLLAAASFAQSGDTTVVQTFTFDAQNNPNADYDSPGRKWFEFPDDGTSYQKILMYYTLKCFSDGTAGGLGYPCGEWDYLTYNYLFQHTGLYDSLASQHPKFKLNDEDFNTAAYSLSPVVNIQQYEQSLTIIDETIEEQTFAFGSESLPLDFVLGGQNGRTQFYVTAPELVSQGLTAGPLHKIAFDVISGTGTVGFLEIKIRNANVLPVTSFDSNTFVTVYSYSTEIMETGWREFVFSQPFNWNGTSNLIFDISFTNHTVPSEVIISGTENTPLGTLSSSNGGKYISFGGGDQVSVPSAALEDLMNETTISFWLNGNPAFQPENGTTFEGVTSSNQRVLNSHTPWSNSRVYWDAGEDNGYDRIDKAALTTDFAGKWNHWAFTKNAVTGIMNIYLNGVLWHTGNNRFRTMDDIVKFSIGSAAGWSNHYRGRMDDFMVFSKELPAATIAEWRLKEITSEHPNFNDLLFAYNFDEENGNPVLDQGLNGQNGLAFGNPDRLIYSGSELFKNLSTGTIRPNIQLYRGDYVQSIQQQITEVEFTVPPVSLVEYEIQGNNVVPISVDYVWTETNSFTYNPQGEVIATEIVELPETVTNLVLDYFAPPFEVVNRFEIGRFITPYGIQLSLGPEGWTWVYDVTDWAPMLKGMVELEAGNWQELLDMKFLFIEGTPPRDVKRIEKIWSGDFQLSTWDNNILPKTIELQGEEETVKLAATTSGHWFGQGNNCAEFCNNIHKLKVNGAEQYNWQIIEECADNPLFPQGGTWIYDRAGWCPGAPVTQRDFEITPFLQNNQASVEYDITPDPYGNYVFESHAFYYGAINHQIDAEIDQIIAPSNWKIQKRVNPICDEPVVRIRNLGAQPLTSLTFTYGINGQNETFEWTGNLAFMESEDVNLSYSNPAFFYGDASEILTFNVAISNPNGSTDENPSNNATSSQFKRPPTYKYPDNDDNRLIIQTQTNAAFWETKLYLYKSNGDLVWQSNYTQANTLKRDTIQLNAGCYFFHITDTDDDGLSFFANSDGNGSILLRRVGGGTFSTFQANFGKDLKHRFNWDTDLISVEEIADSQLSALIYPNPSGGMFNLDLGLYTGKAKVTVFDMFGRQVGLTASYLISAGQTLPIELTGQAQGTYVVKIETEVGTITRLIGKTL